MARTIPGEFVPSDVNLAHDPAIMRAGPWAELLFRRANEYVKKLSRDGDLYAADIPLIAHGIPKPKAAVDALVKEQLWVATDAGWEIRSWLKWNLSKTQRTERRELNRIGAIKSNHKQGRHDTNPDPECELCQGSK